MLLNSCHFVQIPTGFDSTGIKSLGDKQKCKQPDDVERGCAMTWLFNDAFFVATIGGC